MDSHLTDHQSINPIKKDPKFLPDRLKRYCRCYQQIEHTPCTRARSDHAFLARSHSRRRSPVGLPNGERRFVSWPRFFALLFLAQPRQGMW